MHSIPCASSMLYLIFLIVLLSPSFEGAFSRSFAGNQRRDRLSSVSQIFRHPFPLTVSPSLDANYERLTTDSEVWRYAADSLRLRRQRKDSVSFHRQSSHESPVDQETPTDATSEVATYPIITTTATNATPTKKPVKSSCSTSDDVHALLDDIVCSKDYLKTLVTASKRCNLFGYFDADHLRSCGVDANGTYCRKHEREFPDPDYVAWNVLQQCTLQTTSGKCSSACKSSLSLFAAEFGCCIHVSRISWFVEDNPHILILSSALWSFCGLKRPKTCSNVPSLPTSTIAGSCTYGCYAYARSALICEHVGAQLIETYNTCGRKGSALELGQLCGLNDKGTACFELQFTDNTDYLLSVYTSCFNYFSSGACTDRCKKALRQFRSKYGCCVNVYNGTAFGDSSQLLSSIVTSYGLWSRCGVESPGMCSLPDEIETGNRTYNVQAFCDRILTGGTTSTRESTATCFFRVLFVVFVMYIYSS